MKLKNYWSSLTSWLLAKLDRAGIKVIPAFDHDDNETSWAEDL